MNKLTEAKYFRCKGAALKALRDYKNEIDALVEEHDTLAKKFHDIAIKQKEVREAKLFELWNVLMMHMGLDPNKTWQNAEYQIETRYIDEGFGAIVYEPKPGNPLATLLSQQPEEDEEKLAVIELPDKGMLN